ncbi:hypothetical protein ACIQ6R_13420 [Streptomyces sp. NPDC096048]|uniref:hypothetical protein n=1 Tax=Streptomyces sp. NPDC096048 TaxID=3366072 RepID=UPI00380B5874
MTGYRCTATSEVHAEVRAMGETISSPHGKIEWTPYSTLQCLLEDVPHDFHAAFLRTGTRADPASDVYLCWRDGSLDQCLADLDCCMARPEPRDAGCTIFEHHPGRCQWEYIDPEQVAAQAQADQLVEELGLSHCPHSAWDAPPL